MTGAHRSDTVHAVRGSVEIFSAESLMVPVGLLIVAFLSRRLGVGLYGDYVLLIAVVTWLEWGVTSLFARATVQLVAESGDWAPAAATIVWLHGVAGLVVGGALLAGAGPLASALGAPGIAPGFRILAFDVPLFCLAQAHRQVAVGIGRYRVRALAAGGRSVARLALVVGLVSLGLSVRGALLAQVGASVVELAICRAGVRPSWWHDRTYPVSRVLAFAWPLFGAAIFMRLFERVDLFMVQRLILSPEVTAVYGAAQQLALLPYLVSTAVVPVLSSRMARLTSTGATVEAGQHLAQGIRAVTLLLPLVAIPAGSGADVASFVFGAPFAAAGSLLGPLLVAVICYVGMNVAVSAFIAAGKPAWTLVLATAVLAAAFGGDLAVIPRLGARGAALVTMTAGAVGAISSLAVASRLFGARVALRPLLVTLLVAAGGYVASAAVPSHGWGVVLELAALGALSIAALFATRALTRTDVALLRSALLPARLDPTLPARD